MVGGEDMDRTELLSPAEWVSHARSKSVQKKRELMIRYWVQANDFTGPTEGIKAIQKGGLYKSFNNAVEFLESRGMAPNTLAQWRGGYRSFIKACIGYFDDTKYESLVKNFQGYTITEKLCPKPEEFRELLLKGNAREKALVSFLGVTGMRINEVLSRKRSDIEFDYPIAGGVKVPARVRVEAGATKKKYLRYSFLSRESVKLLKDFWTEGRESQWVFPAMWSEREDSHADYFNVLHQMKNLFKRIGLKPKQAGQVYSPHSFRSFAQMIMRRSGFSDTWNGLIVGHRNLETKSYKGDWDEIAASWLERVEPHANFLTAPTDDMQKLEGALKAQKAEFETHKAQWDQITKDMATLRDAFRRTSEAGTTPEAVTQLSKEIETLKNQAQARMSLDTKTKHFDNHVWSYVKCRMSDPDFDEALIEGYEILLQSPDGWVALRKPKPSDSTISDNSERAVGG